MQLRDSTSEVFQDVVEEVGFTASGLESGTVYNLVVVPFIGEIQGTIPSETTNQITSWFFIVIYKIFLTIHFLILFLKCNAT